MNRRAFLGTVTASLALGRTGTARQEQAPKAPAPKGRLKQGVTRGVFGRGVASTTAAGEAARLGIKGFDLIGPPDWPIAQEVRAGAVDVPAGAGRHDPDALNRTENHAKLEAAMRRGDRRSRRRRRAEYHHVLGQSRRHGRCGRRRQLRGVPQRGEGAGRGQGRHHLHGVPEQQGESQGLHVRPHRVGRGRR